MDIGKLTFFGFYLNGASGSRKYDYITIDIIKDVLENGNLFAYLESELKRDIQTTFSDEDKKFLQDEWYDISMAVDEGRKMCVEEGGLCLLMAYVLESIQRAR